jgi:hypothetical protein
MGSNDKGTRPRRQYPPFWERVVPIALAVIAVLIAILLLAIIAAALGSFPGAG